MNSRHSSLPSLPWLICLLFPIGYLLTFDSLQGLEFEYFALTLISVACVALCVIALRRPLREAIPAWTILAALLAAYYAEFYEVVLAPWAMLSFPVKPPTYYPIPRIFFSCFATITIALIGFTAATCLHYGGSRRPQPSPQPASHALSVEDRPNWAGSRTVRTALAISILLVITTSVLVQRFNMVLGLKKASPLPFHLQGFVVYIRLVTVPSLLLLITYLGIMAKCPRWKNSGILLLMLYALSDMLLRASKGTLALELLGLAMLWVAAGQRVTSRQVLFVTGIALATVMLFPILEVFRGLRASNHAISGALLQSVAQNTDASNFKNTLSDSIFALTMRLTGTGALLSIIERDIRPLGFGVFRVLAGPLGMQGYVTFDVFGAPLEEVGSFGMAPSLLGYFYLLSSNLGVGIGMFVFSLASFGFWNLLIRLKLRALPVDQAMFLFLLFGAATEGTLDVQIFKVGPVYVASILLIEALTLLDARAHGRTRTRARAFRAGALSPGVPRTSPYGRF